MHYGELENREYKKKKERKYKKKREEEIQSSSKILENLLSCVACEFVGRGWEKNDNAGSECPSCEEK